MTATRTPTRREARGSRATLERRILASRDSFWQASKLPGGRSSVQHLLTDLVKRGELRHVRKDLYWRGIKTPLGMSPPPPDRITRELVGTRGVGPAGLSAANALRLSTQVPRKAQVAVPDRPPTSVGPVAFVSRAARSGRRRESLSAQEVALLEVLDGWDRVIEVPLNEAWKRLLEVMSSGSLRPERLARAAVTEPGQVRARLNRLLAEAGVEGDWSGLLEADRRHVKALDADLLGSR